MGNLNSKNENPRWQREVTNPNQARMTDGLPVCKMFVLLLVLEMQKGQKVK